MLCRIGNLEIFPVSKYFAFLEKKVLCRIGNLIFFDSDLSREKRWKEFFHEARTIFTGFLKVSTSARRDN